MPRAGTFVSLSILTDGFRWPRRWFVKDGPNAAYFFDRGTNISVFLITVHT